MNVEYVDKKLRDTIGFSIFGCVTEPIGWDVHYAVYDYVKGIVWQNTGVNVRCPIWDHVEKSTEVMWKKMHGLIL